MARKRKSFEEGHRRKFLVIIDDTPECSRALAYAAKRAERTGGAITLLYIIKPSEFQHWIGVENVMRAEAMEEAETALTRYAQMAHLYADIEAETLVEEGAPIDVITQKIENDEDIAILVLASSAEGEGPGPLVSGFTGKSGQHFPIPFTIVPGDLTDEEIATVA